MCERKFYADSLLLFDDLTSNLMVPANKRLECSMTPWNLILYLIERTLYSHILLLDLNS